LGSDGPDFLKAEGGLKLILAEAELSEEIQSTVSALLGCTVCDPFPKVGIVNSEFN
jgi:hypothetical protein